MSSAASRLEIAGPAVRSLSETLPPKVAAAAYAFITGPLLDDPRRVGKPVERPLAPAWSARRGAYRILYLIDDGAGIVRVTAVRHRSDAYRP
ncbi:MAG TPA: type II toxin-antitoxin system RelE/ParE family toxin [Solirubrobacteraceae bacterium]|nr:type II toxin-antitoxin system RelE/ParE family toxin [Solirubrobacteraceae bacterium]